MPVMNKAQAAYLAGLIDGEGYISLHPNRSGKQTYYQPVIKIGMTDKPLIEWLHRTFGGSIEHRVYENPNFNDSFCWSLNGKKLKNFLKHVEPYLKIKRENAQILLEKYRMQERNAGRPYSIEELETIEKMYLRMRQLNRRGRLPIGTLND